MLNHYTLLNTEILLFWLFKKNILENFWESCPILNGNSATTYWQGTDQIIQKYGYSLQMENHMDWK